MTIPFIRLIDAVKAIKGPPPKYIRATATHPYNVRVKERLSKRDTYADRLFVALNGITVDGERMVNRKTLADYIAKGGSQKQEEAE